MIHTHAQIPLQMLVRSKKGDFQDLLTARQKSRVKEFRPLETLIPLQDVLHRRFLELLRGLLVVDPKLRLSAAQALNHPFFTAPVR